MSALLGRARPNLTHPIDGAPEVRMRRVRRGNVLSVTGPTGAPGRTFLSINLAAGLVIQGLRVVLVDADPHLGAVAVQLDLAEDRSLIYLAHEAAIKPVDDALVLRHVQTVSGLDVLTGRSVAGFGETVASPVLKAVIQVLRRQYDVIVIDAGALDCEPAQRAALLSQLIVWAVVSTKVGLDLLDRTLAGPLAGEVRTRASLAILNRLGPPGLRDVEHALRGRYGMAVAAPVPEQRRASIEAEDRGSPAVMSGALAKPLLRCARVIAAALPASLGDVQPSVGGNDARLAGEYVGDT
jgi:MinD-like ATPase involved in chromosome partitioning or flagellar assembly